MCTLLSYVFLGTMKANLIVLTPTLRIDSFYDLFEHPETGIYYGVNSPAESFLFVSAPLEAEIVIQIPLRKR